MKRTYYLSEPEGKKLFVAAGMSFFGNWILQFSIGLPVYIFLMRYTDLDARQLSAIIIAMLVASRFSFKFDLGTNK